MTIPTQRLGALFSDDDAERLDLLLEPFLDHGGLPLESVDGVLSAIVVSPDAPPLSAALPLILGTTSPAWSNADDERAFHDLLQRLHQHITRRVSHAPDDSAMPFLMMPMDDDAFDEAALERSDFPLAANWAVGFMLGIDLRSDAWDTLIADDDAMAEAFDRIASLLPDIEAGEDAAADEGEGHVPLRWSAAEEAADAAALASNDGTDDASPLTLGERMSLVAELPDLLNRMNLDRLDRMNSRAPVRRDAKVGRNDPCPCGSGRKYKKCHGGAVE